MFYKKIIIISLALFFGWIFVANADVVGIAANQGVFSFELDPGSQKEFSIELENTSQNPESISLDGQDIVFGDNNVLEGATAVNELSGMKDWIAIAEKKYILNAKEKRNIPITIKVPNDATVGSHYAMLSVNALPEITGDNFQSTLVGGKIGIYVLVNVRGNASGRGELRTFQAPIITNTDANIKAEFENTGNIHYIPHGEIHIQNVITRKKEDLETEKHFVFPGKKYAFELNWKPSSRFGAYKAEAFFVDGDGSMHVSRRFMFGRFFFVLPIFLLCVGFVGKRYLHKKVRI